MPEITIPTKTPSLGYGSKKEDAETLTIPRSPLRLNFQRDTAILIDWDNYSISFIPVEPSVET